MADTDQIEAIRAHVEKHKDRERAMFTVAGVSAILSELSRLTEAEKRLRGALEPFASAADHARLTGKRPHDFAITEDFYVARRALQGSDNG
jgi:hypothetical protein